MYWPVDGQFDFAVADDTDHIMVFCQLVSFYKRRTCPRHVVRWGLAHIIYSVFIRGGCNAEFNFTSFYSGVAVGFT